MFVRSIRLFFETENQYILLTLPILRLTRVPYLSDVSICSVVFSRIEEDIVKISHAILSITLIQLVSFLYIDCGMLQTIENGCGFVSCFFRTRIYWYHYHENLCSVISFLLSTIHFRSMPLNVTNSSVVGVC